jgi:hypothetical protein
MLARTFVTVRSPTFSDLMMNAVVFHPEDQDVSERAREEPGIPVAAFFIRRVTRASHLHYVMPQTVALTPWVLIAGQGRRRVCVS